MNNQYELIFDKTITKLAGYDLGEQIFNEQLNGSIDYSQEITLVFPERIDSIASSFIQGFFKEIMNEIGISGIENKIIIISSIDNLKDFIIQNLL